jgi:L-cysteine/cystine lyase
MGPVSTIYADTLVTMTNADVAGGRAVAERYRGIEHAGERLRKELSVLLGCEPGAIRLTQSTSAGLEAAIGSIDWCHGDEVVSTDAEHSACAAPLRRLAERHGVVVRIARLPEAIDASADRIEQMITPKTRMIAVSAVTFETGARLPVDRIAAIARARGILTLVDGAQCAGAAPLLPADFDIDFCAIPLQKWLCGPEGLGALYVRARLAPSLPEPPVDRVRHGRGVLEAAAAQLEWMRETLDWNRIFEGTAALAAYAREALATIAGAQVLTPATHAGIVTVRCSAGRLTAPDRLLAERGYAVRHLPALESFRVSTAHFNTTAEIDGLVDEIAALGAHA